MARFVDLSENELLLLLQEKDAENTKKYLEEKGVWVIFIVVLVKLN